MKTLAVTTVCVLAILLAPMPSEAKWLALVPIGLALFMAVLSEIGEARARVDAADAEDTRRAQEFFARLRKYIDEEEADWAEFLGTVHTDRAPLGSVTPLPTRPRVIQFPSQRDGGV